MLVLALYTVLAILLTWPLITRLTVAVPSFLPLAAGDPNMFLWLFDLTSKYLTGGLAAAPDMMLFWPHGISLLAGYDGPLMLIIGVPLTLLSGNTVLAYNIFVLFCLIAAAWTAYGLVWRLTSSRFAAVTCGVIFGFSPYMLVRTMQHPNLLMTFVLPLLFWASWDFFFAEPGPTTGRSLRLAGAILLTALSS